MSLIRNKHIQTIIEVGRIKNRIVIKAVDIPIL